MTSSPENQLSEASVAGFENWSPGAGPRGAFVGRTREMNALAGLFQADARLVTVVGAPGLGKTRLANEFLTAAKRGFEARVEGDASSVLDRQTYFFDLRGAQSCAGFCSVIARGLGMRWDGDDESPDDERVGDALNACGDCLIVLDNFEHLVDVGATVVGRWVDRAPQLHCLLTSRRVLGLRSERVFELGPLPVPRSADDVTCASTQLFLDRAARIEDGFSRPESRSQDLYALVVRLEGVPLALELAAAQMRRMSPRTLLGRLGGKVLKLTSPHRDVDPRHTTLRTAIESSWSMLSETERKVLAQLTVFRSPFSTEAAEAVVSLGTLLEVGKVSDVIGTLREASLLLRAPDDDGDVCWDMFETVREYASEQLTGEEADALACRHARHFLEWGERAYGASPRCADVSLGTLTRRADDICLALSWFLERGETVATQRCALVFFEAVHRSMPRRAQRALSDAVACSAPGDRQLTVPDCQVGRVRLARATASRALGEYDDALVDLDLAAAVLTDSGDAARVDCERGLVAMEQGDPVVARRWLNRALVKAQDASNALIEALVRFRLGWVLAEGFVDQEALEQYAMAAGAFDAVGARDEAIAVRIYWWFDRHLRFQLSKGDLTELLTLLDSARRVKDRQLQVEAIHALGYAEYDSGHMAEACSWFSQGLELTRRGGLKYEEQCVLFNLAMVLDEAGERIEAVSCSRDLLELTATARNVRVRALAQLVLSGLQARGGMVSEAESLLAEAEEAFRESVRNWPPMAVLLPLKRGQLELAQSRQAWARGDLDRCEALRASAAERLDAIYLPTNGQEGLGPECLRSRSLTVRIFASSLHRQLESTYEENPFLRVWRDGSAVQVAGQPVVRLPRGPAIRRVLLAFAKRRGEMPGRGVSTSELLREGWPGERISEKSGTLRVYNAVSRLRRLGLGETLRREDAGYFLDPRLKVSFVPISGA